MAQWGGAEVEQSGWSRVGGVEWVEGVEQTRWSRLGGAD